MISPKREEQLARYTAGDMTDKERLAFENEALDDHELSRALYREVNALEGLAEAGEHLHAQQHAAVEASRPGVFDWLRGNFWRWAIPTAAAAVVVFGVVSQLGRDPSAPPTFRGNGAKIQGIEPAGDLSKTPREFSWTPVEGALKYRFELFDESDRRVLNITTTEASLTLDDAQLTQLSIQTGYWRVSPLDENNFRGNASPPMRFRIVDP